MTGSILRLVCFPHAGSSGIVYAPWRPRLAGRLAVRPMDLPGRTGRAAEPLPATMEEMLAGTDLACATAAAQEYVLYGHSLGALLAFEVARRLSAAGRGPQLLVVSGRNGPAWSSPFPPVHELPDRELMTAVDTMGGSTSRLQDEPAVARLLLPVLRADLKIAETYRYRDRGLLDCPILSVQGEQDPLVSRPGVSTWAAETRGRSVTRWLPGGHFFHLTGSEFLDGLPRLVSDLTARPGRQRGDAAPPASAWPQAPPPSAVR